MGYKQIDKISNLDGTERGLYKIVFSNKDEYIGRSIDIRKRLYTHAGAFRKGIHKNNNFNINYKICGEPQYFICETVNELVHEKTEIWNTAPSINNRIPSKNIIQHKTSHFVGVTWRVSANKWIARYRNKHIGFFETEEAAHDAYTRTKLEATK